jgi:DNA-binding MarR family transcriptional regulator
VLGLSDNDVLAVQHLARAGRMTPSELGRELGLTSGGTTALIQRLERAGHLTREPHPTDRRSVRLTLTPEVARRATEALAPMVQAIDALADALPPADRETVARFLEEVATLSERHADELARLAVDGDAAAPALTVPSVWA